MAGQPTRAAPRSSGSSSRKTNNSSRKPVKRSLLGRVVAKPGVIVAGAAFAAVMTGIVANALLFQKTHHAAPLFGGAPAQRASAEPAKPAVIPASAFAPPTAIAPAAVPVETVPPAAAVAPETHASPKVAKHTTTTPVHKAAHPPAHKDALGDLIARTQPDR